MSEVALFESALRAAVRTRPDPRLGATLVPRLAATARASALEAETHAVGARRRPRSRLAPVARVGIVVALIPLVLAGLAFAGVTVPGAARSAFNSVGIALPNQPPGDDEGTTIKTTTEPSSSHPVDEGAAERGKSKSERAHQGESAAAQRHALAQRQKATSKPIRHTRGKAIGLTGSIPPGHSGEAGPPPHSNPGGTSNPTTPLPPPPPDNPGIGQGRSW